MTKGKAHKRMSRFELCACGVLMYGGRWKTDLCELLGYSKKGRMMGLISAGKRTVTASKKLKMSEQLLGLSEALRGAHDWLNGQNTKILITPAVGTNILLSGEGIIVTDEQCVKNSSPYDIWIPNAKPVGDISQFASMVISIAHNSSEREGDNADMIELIMDYFDLRLIQFNPKEYLLKQA